MNFNHQDQDVQPIKDDQTLHQVQNTLLTKFKFGRRNYTIFQVGKCTLLRSSDLLRLKTTDVFDEWGIVKSRIYVTDQKTDKSHQVYLHPAANDLSIYRDWLLNNNIHSQWLFPSSWDNYKPMKTNQYYRIMSKTGKILNINYLGTHTMRKTGAYRIYLQSNYDIALVMKLLNHSSQSMTLKYLGIDQKSLESKLDKINFD